MKDFLIEKFRDKAAAILNEDSDEMVHVSADPRGDMDEAVIKSYNDPDAPRGAVPLHGKESDGELVFSFEDKEDAVDLYNFFTEMKLLEPGEIQLRAIEEQYSVAFMPSVVIAKPEMIQAALLHYEEQMEVDESEEEAFESFISGMTELIEASVVKTSGAPKRKKGMGNPFHNKDTGKFDGVRDQAKKGGGSWAIGKVKLKFTGKGKTKEGGLLGKYGSTKHPCGRAARKAGSTTRCWDGKEGAGARVARVLGKKKRAKEDLNIADLSIILEMRSLYKQL